MNYENKTKKELIEVCKTNKIKGYSSKNKNEIISLIYKTLHNIEYSKVPQWDYVDPLLKYLAKVCIDKNQYRQKGYWGFDDLECYEFDEDLVEDINKSDITGSKVKIVGGYMFLDKENGKEGMIRLYDNRGGNPKWSFWMEGDEIKVDYA